MKKIKALNQFFKNIARSRLDKEASSMLTESKMLEKVNDTLDSISKKSKLSKRQLFFIGAEPFVSEKEKKEKIENFYLEIEKKFIKILNIGESSSNDLKKAIDKTERNLKTLINKVNREDK